VKTNQQYKTETKKKTKKMPVRLRLARLGRRNHPVYRIVAADSRCPRDGRHLEVLGTYRPTKSRTTQQKELLLRSEERIQYWLAVGAQPSDRVGWLLSKAKLYPDPIQRTPPTPVVPTKLMIRDVKPDTLTEKQLKAVFRNIGTSVLDVRMGKQKFGFVTVSNAEEAKKALEYVKEVNGIPVRLELAKGGKKTTAPTPTQQSTPPPPATSNPDKSTTSPSTKSPEHVESKQST
jgi:small subunit ribosomal protein S16